MMGNRKLPFGYRMELGDIILHPDECECVRLLFDRYQHGDSFNELVELMKDRGVPYDEGKPWNKNMIARVLENEKYTGQEPYPAIIGRDQFDAIRKIRMDKRSDIEKSPAQKVLRKLCGIKVTNHIERQVLHLLNGLVEHPELVQVPIEPMQSRAKMVVLQKKLDDTLAQQPINEELARQLIRDLAAAEYDTISSAEYETERIRRLFLNAEMTEELNDSLLQKCVSKVLVSTDRTARLKMKNGQIIERSVLP